MKGTKPSSEKLVVGLCGAVGSCVDEVEKVLKECLRSYCYFDKIITIEAKDNQETKERGFLDEVFDEKAKGTKHQRALKEIEGISNPKRQYQAKGDWLRCQYGSAILAECIKKQINERSKGSGRVACIVRSLKHENEVAFLKDTFGKSYLQISVHREVEKRIKKLKQEGNAEHDILDIIGIDKSELKWAEENADLFPVSLRECKDEEPFQNVDKAFRYGDLFVRGHTEGELGCKDMEKEIRRFIRLCAGDYYITPNKDEYAMHMAYTASLRSTDLSKQVGAVIVDKWGYIISIGWNELPIAGGGVYEDGAEPDCRDFAKGEYPKYTKLREMLAEYRQYLKKNAIDPRKDDEETIEKEVGFWKSKISDLTRTMHGEMAAIISAARRGVSIAGGTIYVTDFPCHNCMKHIIGSGIERVIYLDAYEKSLAFDLHGEELSTAEDVNKVQIIPYTGVHPIKIDTLFQRIEKKLHTKGEVKAWDSSKADFKTKLGLD